jgi:hypothetical protein
MVVGDARGGMFGASGSRGDLAWMTDLSRLREERRVLHSQCGDCSGVCLQPHSAERCTSAPVARN